MKKIKLFLCIALFGAMSFGAFSAYDHLTMSEEERFLLANIEALTIPEPGGGDDGPHLKTCYNDFEISVGNYSDRECGTCKYKSNYKKVYLALPSRCYLDDWAK